MVNAVHHRLNASDRSYFAILKKEIHALASGVGFSAKKLAEIDIVVAEIVSNLAKHAGGGELLVKIIEQAGIPGIELISVDNGPGINDLNYMMQDGASSKKTLGQGLGAIKRLSDFLQIYTNKAWGTILLCRFFLQALPAAASKDPVEIRSVVIPKPGETACGDGFSYKQTKQDLRLFLGDGLGHGPEAAAAVAAADEAFRTCPDNSPCEIIRFMHTAVKKTRGLVGTVAIFNFKEKQWRLCGVGNIATRMQSRTFSKNYISYNGIIGLNIPGTMNDQEIPYEKGQHMVLCSDGIRSRWDLLKYTGIFRYDLSILATALLKDHTRNTDDSSVVSCKINV
ncbi:MAG: SpoIIE family protein phosphatase [Candidatus Pseudobacter hemicellulosilyticus]|uniref:SpoIIE family protein phosphatase n=1 Tax=Candidatus Pseudobacter hemicellulosilyticus TaxID=3121375 RepID=A0AAJ6BI43_9BACT|nr:MAG: SpoIIE family protein phosphatase [Pseudobacter sp.]